MSSETLVINPQEDLVVGESMEVREGVWCLTLTSESLDTEDYGFIAIAPTKSTPEQLVWEGDTITIESFVCGKGLFILERKDGEVLFFKFDENSIPFLSIVVMCGDTMIWVNKSKTDYLFVFETCQPKFKPGRFLDLD